MHVFNTGCKSVRVPSGQLLKIEFLPVAHKSYQWNREERLVKPTLIIQGINLTFSFSLKALRPKSIYSFVNYGGTMNILNILIQ